MPIIDDWEQGGMQPAQLGKKSRKKKREREKNVL
jgi:hypothetical protein